MSNLRKYHDRYATNISFERFLYKFAIELGLDINDIVNEAVYAKITETVSLDKISQELKDKWQEYLDSDDRILIDQLNQKRAIREKAVREGQQKKLIEEKNAAEEQKKIIAAQAVLGDDFFRYIEHFPTDNNPNERYWSARANEIAKVAGLPITSKWVVKYIEEHLIVCG